MRYACLIVSVLLFSALHSNGQPGNKEDFINSLFASRFDNSFLLGAVDSSICVIRQEYTVIDSTGNEFGANGLPYWGIKYAVGVYTDSGLYTGNEILLPWNGDKELEVFLKTEKNKFKPHLSKCFSKRIFDKTFVRVKGMPLFARPDSSLISFATADSLPQIATSLNSTDSTGWLLIVYSKTKPDQNDSIQVNCSIVTPKLVLSDSSKMYLKNLTVQPNYLGGIYFTRKTSLGKILFSAAGLMQRDKKGWYVRTFLTEPPDKKSEKPKLTPVVREGD